MAEAISIFPRASMFSGSFTAVSRFSFTSRIPSTAMPSAIG